MNAPSVDIKDLLDAESSLALAFNTNLFLNEIPETAPDLCVGVFDSGGLPPTLGYVYEYPTVQVRVRGTKGDFRPAEELARDIKRELHGVANHWLDSVTRIVLIQAMGEPFMLGRDDNGRPIFTINFQIHRTESE
jgi:hypothetical protein